MFRRDTIESFNRKLRHCFFTEHAFEVREGGTEGAFLTIIFRPRRSFFFEVRPGGGDVPYWVTWAPGENLLTAERIGALGPPAIGERLEQWIGFLQSELASPERCDAEQATFRELFFRSLAAVVADLDEPFTNEERNSLNLRLADLEEKLVALLGLESGGEERIEELRKLFFSIESATKNTNKSTWIYAMGGRLLNHLVPLTKSEQGSQLVQQFVQKMAQG